MPSYPVNVKNGLLPPRQLIVFERAWYSSRRLVYFIFYSHHGEGFFSLFSLTFPSFTHIRSFPLSYHHPLLHQDTLIISNMLQGDVACQEQQQVQAVRAVNKDLPPTSVTPARPEEVYYVDTHPDPETQKPVVLWDDIHQAFDNAVQIRDRARVVPFLKGADLRKYVIKGSASNAFQWRP